MPWTMRGIKMHQPTLQEFDSWKNSSIGKWYFEFYLQGFADKSAQENGRSFGLISEVKDEDFMIHVRNSGFITGVEYAINTDPFEDSREEAKDED